jgi:hypothetical protein
VIVSALLCTLPSRGRSFAVESSIGRCRDLESNPIQSSPVPSRVRGNAMRCIMHNASPFFFFLFATTAAPTLRWKPWTFA